MLFCRIDKPIFPVVARTEKITKIFIFSVRTTWKETVQCHGSETEGAK